MTHLLALITPLDPLHGDGYQFWSGIGSGSPLIAGVALGPVRRIDPFFGEKRFLRRLCLGQRSGHDDGRRQQPECNW